MAEHDAPEQNIRYPSPMREKYWEECTPEEKIDRCRQQLKIWQMRYEGLDHLVQRLLRHAHLGEQLVMLLERDVPLGYGMAVPRNQDSPDVYF